MTSPIVVLVPVLDRPQNVKRLLRTLHANSSSRPEILFLLSPGDEREQEALREAGAPYSTVGWKSGRADWAKKLEHGRQLTSAPLMLLAADDLAFHKRWDTVLIDAWRDHEPGVLGTNDLGNPNVKRGLHSTHPCVWREYADCHGTIDDAALMLHQGYDHQYADNELVETAMARNCWLYCADSVVEHLHPAWGKGDRDGTYAKAYRQVREDYRLFRKRRRLWTGNRRGILRLTETA